MNILITGLDLTNAKQVLLLAPDNLSENDLFRLNQELKERFHNCEFVLLSGDFKVLTVNNDNSIYQIES